MAKQAGGLAVIRVDARNRAALEAYLRQHMQCAMFPLANLQTYGLNGVHEYAMRYWLAMDAGAVVGAIGLSNNGSLMPVWPEGDWAAVRAVLAGEALSAFIGPSGQVRPLMAALGATGAPANLDDDEPHFALDLAKLRVPDGPGEIVPIAAAPRDVMLDWMLDYETTALGLPMPDAQRAAERSYENYCTTQSHVVLMEGDTPLAMTGFNARLPDMVQIGGVYTPPSLRGRGHARRALALHLAEARSEGVRQSVLFSASEAAARAYRALGYERIGDWTLCLLAQPVTIGS